MNYGFPKIGEELKKLKIMDAKEFLSFLCILNTHNNNGSVSDNVNRYLAKERWQPTIRFVPPYYDDTEYIDTLYHHIKKNLKGGKIKRILCSFHGIPKIFFKGDPIMSLCKDC